MLLIDINGVKNKIIIDNGTCPKTIAVREGGEYVISFVVLW